MPWRYSARVSALLLVAFMVSTASAQTVVDRIVGPRNNAGARVILSSMTGQELSILGKAADVAIGFEGLAPVALKPPIDATGKKLGAVLDAVVAADPRYEWRENDGVIVVRPTESWVDDMSVLRTPVVPLTLDDVMAADVLELLSRMFGRQPLRMATDTRRFSVEVPDGATLIDMLNAVVRAHGTLAWSLEVGLHATPEFPTRLTLNIGASGVGFGIPAGTPVRSVAPAARRHMDGAHAERSILDRPLTFNPRNNGQPLMMGLNEQAVFNLANAAGVPLGFESLPASELPAIPPGFGGINIPGTLGGALDAVVAFDPRYEWRQVDGAILIRPVTAWLDPESPLFRTLPATRLDDVTLSRALAALRAADANSGSLSVSDTRTFSLDVPQGATVLDLLNAISLAHGGIAWAWEYAPVHRTDEWVGSSHRYKLSIRGLGTGFGFSTLIP